MSLLHSTKAPKHAGPHTEAGPGAASPAQSQSTKPRILYRGASLLAPPQEPPPRKLLRTIPKEEKVVLGGGGGGGLMSEAHGFLANKDTDFRPRGSTEL